MEGVTEMRYYGQWNPPVDEVLFRNYFPERKDGFFIECGAGDGVTLNNCLFFEQQGWKGINIEPSPETFEILKVARPNSINLNIGLSDHDGESVFTKTLGSDCSGFITTHPKWEQELKAYGYKFEPTTIKVLTYRSLVHGEPDKPPYPDIQAQLFVLDVDGHELQIIDGMKGTMWMPTVMCVEYTLVTLPALIERLLLFGYNHDFVSFNNAFFSLGPKQDKDWYGKTDIWNWGG